MTRQKPVILTAWIVLIFPVALAAQSSTAVEGTGGPDSITETDITAHIATLASDAFGGRRPSSPGEEATVEYLADQYRSLGLEPGNGDSYFQNVPLVDITVDASSVPFAIESEDAMMSLAYAEDFVTWTTRVVEQEGVTDSEMVFVGYGIVAPEVGWNDYEGLDAVGKTVVMLVNDPGFATQDPDVFSGNSMTYYGRWTYKFEEAARQGAAAALIVHENDAAGYGWSTVRNSWTGPQFHLASADGNASRIPIEGWVTEPAARRIFAAAGLDFDALHAQAATATLRPVDMGLTLTTSVSNSLRSSESRNVIAAIRGTGAPDEYFIYMAHWDHLGTDSALVANGEDGIYNGALDNASGTAALLELAEAYALRAQPPRRSVVFLSLTAEEQGLLGSRYYASNPIYPLAQTVAGLNMDGLSNFGPTRELVVVGYGMSQLDEVAEAAAATQGRRIDPDPQPERGAYFRSDHFELAKMGVPMIFPRGGIDHEEFGIEFGRERNDRFIAERYHMVTDEFDDTWDLSGAVRDVQLYYEIGRRVIESDIWPEWNEGSEFKAIRDASRR